MNIALSCTGEGFGHIARLVALSQHLEKKHQLFYFAPPQLEWFVRENMPQATFVPIPFFRFVFRQDKVAYLRTALANIPVLAGFSHWVKKLSAMLVEHHVEGVVSDFEPFLAEAARRAGIPVVQLNHPSIVLDFPAPNLAAHAARFAARFLMRHYDTRIVCSFYNGTVGPMLRKKVLDAKVEEQDFIVVYLKWRARERVVRELERLGIRNFEFFPREGADFVDALRRCKAVIAAAGHQMMCEALYLGKPLLVIPQQAQYEQALNAEVLEKIGLGMQTTLSRFSKDVVRFLGNLSALRRPRQVPGLRISLFDSTARAASLIEESLNCSASDSPSEAVPPAHQSYHVTRPGLTAGNS